MLVKKIVLALSMCAGLGLTSIASSTTISQDEWTFSSGAMQTDSEWLSLTRADQYTSTASVQSKKNFGPGEIIRVEFDYISWGGVNVGADGLAVYLFDASLPGAGGNGHHYSALGYCRVTGGYIGIGLDEYGNFSSSCEGRHDGGASIPNSATIRGSQAANYGFVKNFPIVDRLDCEGAQCKTREQAINAGVKKVTAYFVPKKDGIGYGVNLSINDRMVINGVDYPHAAPSLVKVGISASNGSYTNNHEIRNLKISGTRQCKR